MAVLHRDGGAGAADRGLSWESIPVPSPEEKGKKRPNTFVTGWLVEGRTDFDAGCKESARELEGERRKTREKENPSRTRVRFGTARWRRGKLGVRVLQG